MAQVGHSINCELCGHHTPKGLPSGQRGGPRQAGLTRAAGPGFCSRRPQGCRKACYTHANKGTLTMPPHPVAGCILQVLVLLIATLHQGIERVVVEVVAFALRTPI